MTEIAACEAELSQIDKTLSKIRKELDQGSVQLNVELETLQNNLIELRQITEDKLIELRKNAMLVMIDNIEEPTSDNSECLSKDCEASLSDDEDDDLVIEAPDKLKVDASILKGQKCSFPYWTSNGIFFYQNAVVHDYDVNSRNVCLVVCNPTRLCEVPCEDWLLTDNCKSTSCFLCHGINVPSNRLYEYQTPDFSNLDENSRCLCLIENETVWRQAVTQHVDLPNEVCYVHLTGCKFQQPITVPLCNIFPLNFKLSNALNSEERLDDLDIDDCESLGMELFEELSSQLTADNGKPFGDWEKFTRGIGSKIMASMGYVPGRGLGKLEDGRANPVPIEVFPPRRSLDKIMQLRNKKRFQPSSSSSTNIDSNIKKNNCLFAFMNNRLSNNGSSSDRIKKSKDNSVIEAHNLSKKSDKDIAIQVYKTSNEITRVRSSIDKLQSSLLRHSGSSTTDSIKKRMNEEEKYLNELVASENRLLKYQEDRNSTKKLKIF